MYTAARVVENRALARGNFVLRLTLPDGGESLAAALPGQFVMLRGEWGRDPLLPRAFSILRLRDGGCEILVKAIGRGTRLLQLAGEGAPLSLLGPLGKPFVPAATGAGDWLVAGGVGLAPLLWFAERHSSPGGHQLIYGARSAEDLVLLDEIRATGATVALTTEDGSAPAGWQSERGRVTDALARLLPRDAASGGRILTCGPNAMMRAVVELARAHHRPCLVSVEGEMACGIGACLGCALPTVAPPDGRPFVYACVDGPVFDAARVVIP